MGTRPAGGPADPAGAGDHVAGAGRGRRVGRAGRRRAGRRRRGSERGLADPARGRGPLPAGRRARRGGRGRAALGDLPAGDAGAGQRRDPQRSPGGRRRGRRRRRALPPARRGRAWTRGRSSPCRSSTGHGTTGAIGLLFSDERSLDATELELLEILADTCAQALQRVAAQEAAEQQGVRLAFLADASTELASSLDYETTLSNVARLAVPTLRRLVRHRPGGRRPAAPAGGGARRPVQGAARARPGGAVPARPGLAGRCVARDAHRAAAS